MCVLTKNLLFWLKRPADAKVFMPIQLRKDPDKRGDCLHHYTVRGKSSSSPSTWETRRISGTPWCALPGKGAVIHPYGLHARAERALDIIHRVIAHKQARFIRHIELLRRKIEQGAYPACEFHNRQTRPPHRTGRGFPPYQAFYSAKQMGRC